jgi:ribosomal protein S18 acetylase RimI-like enzyme
LGNINDSVYSALICAAHAAAPLPQDHQGKGIARRLLGFVASYAKSIGAAAIYLHVATFNAAAIQFYSKLGFVRVAELQNFYSIS